MSKNFSNNKKKGQFISSLPQSFLIDCDISTRSKFNFSYFDNNPPGQDFIDWNSSEGSSKLVKLIGKLKEFTRESLKHWENEKIGKGKRGAARQSCLEVYKEFPRKSAFAHPPHVPEDVWWARFRIDNDARLIGFIIPNNLSTEIAKDYDSNTFYVVFLDENHQFYLK